MGDIEDVFYPLEKIFRDYEVAGDTPLWSQYTHFGFPIIASAQIGFFYPLSLILRLLPLPIFFNTALILHFFLIIFFTFLYCRSLNLSKHASLLGGIVFAFSGFIVGHILHLNIIFAAPYLPLLLFLIEKYLRKKRSYILILMPVILAIQFLAGHFQIPFYAALLFSCYFIFRLSSFKKFGKSLFLLLFIALFAFVLSSIQLLPTLELIRFSDRGSGMNIERANQYSFWPWQFITFIFPGFYDFQENYWGSRQIMEMGAYIGIVPLLLAFFITLSKKKSKVIWFYILVAIGSMLFAIGKYSPLRLIKIEPSLWFFSAPSRFLYLSTFALAILAGFGLDQILSMPKEKLQKLTKGLGLILFALLILVLMSNYFFFIQTVFLQDLAEKIFEFIIKGSKEHVFPWSYYEEKIQYLIEKNQSSGISLNYLDTYFSLFLFFSFFVLVKLYTLKKVSKNYLAAFLVLLSFLELFYFGQKWYSPVNIKEVEKKPQTAKFLQQDKDIYRILTLRETKDTGKIFSNPPKPLPLDLKRELLLPIEHSLFGLSSPEWSASLDMQRHVQYMDAMRSSKEIKNENLLNLANIKYIISQDEIQNPRWEKIYNEEVKIYENEMVLPRLFFAEEIKVEKNSQEILAKMQEPSFSPQNLAYIEEEIKEEIEKERAKEARIISYTDKKIVINTKTDGNSFLVLTDTFYSGWQASLDGQPIKIYQTDYLFRGVLVPFGEHQVVFQYQPKIFAFGKYFSICGWLAVSASLIFLKKIPYFV